MSENLKESCAENRDCPAQSEQVGQCHRSRIFSPTDISLCDFVCSTTGDSELGGVSVALFQRVILSTVVRQCMLLCAMVLLSLHKCFGFVLQTWTTRRRRVTAVSRTTSLRHRPSPRTTPARLMRARPAKRSRPAHRRTPKRTKRSVFDLFSCTSCRRDRFPEK